jgi:hypothetical protein
MQIPAVYFKQLTAEQKKQDSKIFLQKLSCVNKYFQKVRGLLRICRTARGESSMKYREFSCRGKPGSTNSQWKQTFSHIACVTDAVLTDAISDTPSNKILIVK